MSGDGPRRGFGDDRTPLREVIEALRAFNAERDWGQFHTPRDLAMCVSVEAGELLELFLWKAEGGQPPVGRTREELADVVISVLNLASRLGIDVLAAVDEKLARNAERYPVELARGRADKHDVLAGEEG